MTTSPPHEVNDIAIKMHSPVFNIHGAGEAIKLRIDIVATRRWKWQLLTIYHPDCH